MKQNVSPIRVVVAVAAILSTAFTSAAPRVVHYGPFASTSPDSGTCGNTWATDTFQRHFTVDTRPNPDGSYNVVQQFKDGAFVTLAGASPGACETNPGGVVGDGVTGVMHGSIDYIVAGGVFNPSAVCSVSACSTFADFVSTVFGPAATYDAPTFNLHYSAGPNGAWKNASVNRGGNDGDITGNP
jgi:hypothetical protein